MKKLLVVFVFLGAASSFAEEPRHDESGVDAGEGTAAAPKVRSNAPDFPIVVGHRSKKTEVDISLNEGMVQGPLDKKLIEQVIKRNIGQILYCYEKELQNTPSLAGKVAVRFIIAPSGDVSAAKVAENSTINDAALGECITVRVRSWRFPQPKGGGSVTAMYPFLLTTHGN